MGNPRASGATGLLWQPREPQESHLRKLLPQPTRTVTIGHGSPPFHVSLLLVHGGLLMPLPSRRELLSRATVGRGSGIGLTTDAGTPALAYPSTARRREIG